jgi:tetratricopeptide (TPR) repeat protein
MDIRERLSQMSSERRTYTLDSLAYHLKEAKQNERLYELLDQTWMEVKLENHKSHQPFSDDINIAIQASVEEKPSNWIQLVRLGLVFATIRELTEMLPPIALGVMAGLEQVERSKSFAALLNDPEQSAEAFVHIAEALIEQGRKDDAEEQLVQAQLFACQIKDKNLTTIFELPHREQILDKIILAYLKLDASSQAWEISLQMKEGGGKTQAKILAHMQQKEQSFNQLFKYIYSLPKEQHESLVHELLHIWLQSNIPDNLQEFIDQAPFSEKARQQAIYDWAYALLTAGQIEDCIALLSAEEREKLAEVIEKESILALLREYEFKQVFNRVDQLPSIEHRIEVLNKTLSSSLEVGLVHEIFRVAEKLQITLFKAAQSRKMLAGKIWITAIETFLKIPSPSIAKETANVVIKLWKEENDLYHDLRVRDFAEMIRVFYQSGEKEYAEDVLWITTEFIDKNIAPSMVEFDFHFMATELTNFGAFDWAMRFAEHITTPSFRREVTAEVKSGKFLEYVTNGNLDEANFQVSSILDDKKKLTALAQAAAISLKKNLHEQAAHYIELIMENAQTTDRTINRSNYLNQRALYHARQGDLKRALEVANKIWYVDERMNTYAQISTIVAKNNNKNAGQNIMLQLLSELSKFKEPDLINDVLAKLIPALVSTNTTDDIQVLKSLIFAIKDPSKRLQGLQAMMLIYLSLDAKEKAMSVMPDVLLLLENITEVIPKQVGYAHIIQFLCQAGEYEKAEKILEKGETVIKDRGRGNKVYWELFWEVLVGSQQSQEKPKSKHQHPILSVDAYLRLKDFPMAFRAAVATDQLQVYHIARVINSVMKKNGVIPNDWLDVAFEALKDQKTNYPSDSWSAGIIATALVASGQADRAQELLNFPPQRDINQEKVLAHLGVGQQLYGNPKDALDALSRAILAARFWGRERFYGVLDTTSETLPNLLPKEQLESIYEAIEDVETWWSSPQYRDASPWIDGNYTAPNIFKIGDGSPLVLEISPNLERIFTHLTPQAPLQANTKNETFWAEETLENQRKHLVMAYLHHPDPAVRGQMIPLTAQFDAIGIRSLLVDLLADTEPEVRKAAAETIWRVQGDTYCERAISELRHELGGNTTAYPHLQGERRLGQEKALLALDTLIANAPDTNARTQLKQIVQEHIFIPERYESPDDFSVEFINMEYRKGRRQDYAYEVYRAPSSADAIAFLKTKTVKREFYYIEVETPEGVYGCDVEGVYKLD